MVNFVKVRKSYVPYIDDPELDDFNLAWKLDNWPEGHPVVIFSLDRNEIFKFDKPDDLLFISDLESLFDDSYYLFNETGYVLIKGNSYIYSEDEGGFYLVNSPTDLLTAFEEILNDVSDGSYGDEIDDSTIEMIVDDLNNRFDSDITFEQIKKLFEDKSLYPFILGEGN